MISCTVPVDNPGQDRWTRLHCTILSESTVIAGLLLRYGADCNAMRPEQQIRLIAAVIACQIEMVRVLLHSSANLRGVNPSDRTTLFFPARENNLPIANLQLICRADIEGLNDKQEKALML